MYLLILKRIEFRQRDDLQTVAYAKAVPNWLSQWTVANNYAPYLMHGRDAEDRIPTCELIVNDLLDSLDSALPEHFKRTRLSHAGDFTFSYNLYVAEVGKPSRYVGVGSFNGDDILNAVAAEAEAT